MTKTRQTPGPEIVEIAREVAKNHSYRKVDGQILDVQTANVIVKVHDALGEEARQKLLTLNLAAMANICWKAIS